MKKIFVKIVALSFVIFLGSCGVESNNKEEVQERLNSLPDIEVTFNESEGEASLSKNIYILFDGSGSMSESCAGRLKLDGAKEAIIKYIEKVPADYNLGLLVFGVNEGNGIKEVVALGSENHENVKSAVLNIKATGGTPLASATKFGVNQLVKQYKKQLGYGEYRMVIVTDGIANDPSLFEQNLIDASRYSFIATYGIGLCIDGGHLLKAYSMSYTDADDYDKLSKALEETIGELSDFDPKDFKPEDFE